ncbi:MAG TPA: HAD-IIIC family phosphatase [Terriglobia bacterium]|nr:HAD-IIIC family phosphatase [Terriglobia bacterium]
MSSSKTRCLLVSDFNIQPLADFINHDETEPACEAVVAPFGQVTPSLLELASGDSQSRYDAVIVWTRVEGIDDIENFGAALIAAARHVKHLFFVTWARPYFQRDLGIASMRSGGSALNLMRMNVGVCEHLSRQQNIFVLDSNAWISAAGAKAWSSKMWYLSKVPFSSEVFQMAARDFKSAIQAIQGRNRKLIVLDLDDTLWGGIVGEIGWEALRLGGHDPIGEAFADFQRALKVLTESGIVLAIASKNDEAAALEAIDKHPEMVLRRSDFAAWRINWFDKAQNIVDITNELNLDLSAVVYLDDSPAERNRIRSALPAVAVPEWPQDVFLYTQSLLELRYFDKVSVTDEDRLRSSMYVADRERSKTKQAFQSVEDWLKSLDMEVSIEALSKANVARAAQLFNKTNQMNLATRRLNEKELLDWAAEDQHEIYVFRVSDKFGDYGLTGLLGLKVDDGRALITDYLLSCRVMGRGLEQLMLSAAIDRARCAGVSEVRAKYVPTSKNAPCLSFLLNQSQFQNDGEHRFKWPVSDPYPCPAHIVVKK